MTKLLKGFEALYREISGHIQTLFHREAAKRAGEPGIPRTEEIPLQPFSKPFVLPLITVTDFDSPQSTNSEVSGPGYKIAEEFF